MVRQKKVKFYRQLFALVSAIFCSSDSPLLRAFNIYFVCGGFKLSNPVGYIVTYVMLDISVVNSHATSAYECELLAVTWHYLPSV